MDRADQGWDNIETAYKGPEAFWSEALRALQPPSHFPYSPRRVRLQCVDACTDRWS
jgi:hypothetical protein